jgi:OPA family glycerol-3-phosphate transporter-like MFS transporter
MKNISIDDPKTVIRHNSSDRRRAQWRMLFVLMFCYLFYYTGRQNYGWAVPLMLDDQGLGLSATQLGFISGAMLMCYGIGQSINGNLGDKFGARKMVTMGGLLSTALNWITSFGTSFYTILFPWATNGFAQSMGWAPGSRMLSNWWSHSERGKAFGLYVAAAASSSILIFALGILVVTYLPWRWVFRLPVLLLAIASIVFYIIARNRPQDLGYQPVEEDPNHSDPRQNGIQENSWQRYKKVLKNGRFLLASLPIGFESLARYGLLMWVPLHYMGPGWREEPEGLWVTLALPIGMALGALSTGYISDKFFKGNRSRPIAFFLFLAMVVMVLIYFVPTERKIIGLVLLFLAGVLVYGPQSCYWALCPDLFGQYRAATAVGIMNFSAYMFAAGGEPLLGWIIDTSDSTASVFAVLAISCALGWILILPVRK